jgi:N-acetylmuramoyl-L-alanine amidase
MTTRGIFLGIDGGGSTALWDGKRYVIGGEREVPNAIIVEEELPSAAPASEELPRVSPQAYWTPFGGLMADKTVILDPGHGGSSPGTVAADGTPEKVINLTVARHCRDILTTMGARVVMTRDDDTEVSLADRVAIEHAIIKGMVAADVRRRVLFLSDHHNSSVSPKAAGSEVWSFLGGNAEIAAKAIHRYMIAMLGTVDRYSLGPDECKPGEWNNFYVVRETDCPAVLTEAGFMSNPAEYALLREPTFLLKEATAIALGVVDYFAELDRRARQGGLS